MAKKYHEGQGADNKGILVECEASKRACPNGGSDENHLFFNTERQAEEWSELSLTKKYDTLTPGQALRLEELNELSDSLNPSKMIRDEVGFSTNNKLRFRSGEILPGELKMVKEDLQQKFLNSKMRGKNIRDGRVEFHVNNKHYSYYGVGIIAEDIVNGGYIYGTQSRGSFYVNNRSSSLEEVIKAAALDNGYEDDEMYDPSIDYGY